MRKERELAENVWYLVNTSANTGELVFQSVFGVWLFGRTVSEAKERYAFELRRVRMHGVVKPADGLQLPEIMKCRCAVNWDDRRTGHIRGMGRRPTEPPERCMCLWR
jgi:hypothetical protein